MAESASIGILVGTRGRGSNMRALVEACRSGQIPNADVTIVVAPSGKAPALEVARELHVPTVVATSEDELLAAFDHVDLVCLAGYMRLIPPSILQAHPNRVLNIHPALLPKFGGKGMYGHHVHEAVLAAGETESGASVHYVNEVYDDGKVIHQEHCEVRPDDTPETLAERVLKAEHRAYAKAVTLVLNG